MFDPIRPGSTQGNIERLIVPLHGNRHWALMIFDVVNKVFTVYNSLPSSKIRTLVKVQKVVAMLLGIRFEDTETIHAECPSQEANDCGLHV